MTHLPHSSSKHAHCRIVAGAKRGILYIRHEYHLQEEILGEETAAAVASPPRKKILGSELDFELEVFVSPALHLRRGNRADGAIEGHRAEPRNKPPFPVQAVSGKAHGAQ